MSEFLNMLEIVGALLFMIFFFGSCVFVHELGHFLVARKRGLHVDAFSIGFRKIWSKKINGVDYRIGWLPFGGYCELPQVDSTEAVPKAADGTILPKAKPLDRLLTAFSGPFFNILYGLLLGCLVWHFGIPQDSPKMRAIEVLEITQPSPEYDAGLRKGDKIVKLNGKTFQTTWPEFAKDILLTIGPVKLEVERAGKRLEVVYTPIVNPNAPAKLKYEKIAWPFFAPKIPIELYPDAGSIAEKAGIKRGDILESINGRTFDDYPEFFTYIAFSGLEPLAIKLNRNGESMLVNVQPEAIPNQQPLNLFGFSYEPETTLPTITAIDPKRPAGKADIKPGDVIRSLNGKSIESLSHFREMLHLNGNKEARFLIGRGDQELEVVMTPDKIVLVSIGLGIGLKDYPNPFQQFAATIDLSYKSLRGMLTALASKLHMTTQTSSIQGRHMSGPIGIASTLYQSVHKASFMTGIYFVVIICFALAIFNLLPLPVLDGGHILLALIEIIFGRPLPVMVVKGMSIVFVTLLIGLMLYVTYFDLLRLAPNSLREKLDGPVVQPLVEQTHDNTPK